jgi:hypothetical protein
LFTLIEFGGEYKLWRSSLCNISINLIIRKDFIWWNEINLNMTVAKIFEE